jgi:hypothetical protein
VWRRNLTVNYNLTHSLIGRPFLLRDWIGNRSSPATAHLFGPSSNSSQSSTASSTDVNESPNDASGDSSHSETKQNSVSGDDIIFADLDTDEVLLFAGADVTTKQSITSLWLSCIVLSRLLKHSSHLVPMNTNFHLPISCDPYYSKRFLASGAYTFVHRIA